MDLQPFSGTTDSGADTALHLEPAKVDALFLPLLMPPGLVSEGGQVHADETHCPPGLQLPARGVEETRNRGSILHGTGVCRPCAWFWKATGCQNGEFCEHCHVCPVGELRQRKKEKLAMMRLGLATPKAVIDQEQAYYAAAFSGAVPPLPNFHLNMFLPPAFAPVSPALVPSTPPTMPSMGGLDEAASTTCGGSDDSDADVLVSTQSSPPGLDPLQALSIPVTLPSMPLWPGAAVLSLGSMQHGSGMCRPCAWFWRVGGCENQTTCVYCHLCSEGELKTRKKSKQAMMRMGLITPKSGASSSDNEARYPLSLSACV